MQQRLDVGNRAGAADTAKKLFGFHKLYVLSQKAFKVAPVEQLPVISPQTDG